MYRLTFKKPEEIAKIMTGKVDIYFQKRHVSHHSARQEDEREIQSLQIGETKPCA